MNDLPMATRTAMLAAVEAEHVIAGAYIDRGGRVCPMLAAHRRGARTEAANFARAWDAFARARRPRAATKRELEILVALLQESLDGADPAQPPVAAEHGDASQPSSAEAPA